MEEKLRIDDREDDEAKMEVKRVCKELKIPYEVERIDTGDYVYGNVAIERKAIDDLGKSITGTDPKIVGQSSDMAEEYERAFIFIVGDREKFSNYQRGRIGFEDIYKAIKKKLPHIISEQNVPVCVVRSEPLFGDVSVRVLRDCQTEHSKMVMIRPSSVSDDRFSMICGISQLGRDDAEAIFSKFGSFSSLASATPPDLLDIDGIGTKKAKRIYMTINSDFEEPGFDYQEADDDRWNKFERWMNTSGVGEEVLEEIYIETHAFDSDPVPLVEKMDLGPHREEILLEKIGKMDI